MADFESTLKALADLAADPKLSPTEADVPSVEGGASPPPKQHGAVPVFIRHDVFRVRNGVIRQTMFTAPRQNGSKLSIRACVALHDTKTYTFELCEASTPDGKYAVLDTFDTPQDAVNALMETYHK